MAAKLPDWRVITGGFDSGAGSGTGKPFEEVPIGPKDGVNRTFRLTYAPWLGFLQLYLNGNDQSKFVPRFSLSGNVVTYAIAPEATDELYCWYFRRGGAVPGRAREFAGGSDVVNWGSTSPTLITGNMSAMIWFKLPSGSNGQSTLLARGINDPASAKNTCYGLVAQGSADAWLLKYWHDYGTNHVESHDFAAAIRNDAWTCAAFVRDVTAKTVSLYTGNGTTMAAVGTFSYTNNPDGGTDPACLLTIGNYAGGVGDFPDGSHAGPLVGTTQEYYIWSRSLTLTELISAMKGNPSTTGMVLGCPSGTSPEIDLSSSGGSGTLTGTTLVGGHN